MKRRRTDGQTDKQKDSVAPLLFLLPFPGRRFVGVGLEVGLLVGLFVGAPGLTELEPRYIQPFNQS